MKKQITAIITAALILTNFTACSAEKEPINNSSNNSSETFDNSGNEIENSTAESSTQSTPESIPEPVPVEFTDEDRELQAILAELYDPTDAIIGWFNHMMVSIDSYPDAHDWKLIIPEISYKGVYIQVPDNYYLISESFYVPTTKAGMRDLFQKYFTKERTDSLMKRFMVCESIEKSDKKITLKLKNPETFERVRFFAQFIEVDGHLYAADGYGTNGFIVVESAKVTNKTDDTIEFTFLMSNYIEPEYLSDTSLYLEAAQNGSIKLEDGVWKLHTWDDWNFPL